MNLNRTPVHVPIASLACLAACLLASPPLSAQSAAPAAGPASVSEWGMPIGGPAVPSAEAPASAASAPRSVQSRFAAARAGTSATGDYFHDFGELIVRVRSVKWIEEICSEAFPATAEVNEHAYDDWLLEHGKFVREMEGQFAVIEKYWTDASPDMVRKEGLTADQLRAKVDANREGLREDFLARGGASFQRRCEAYPEILLSPQLDLEKSQADYVTSVRAGPR